jgi:hypothetical protein
MPIKRIALVGHCGFDSGSLQRFASEAAPAAEVVRVNDQQGLDQVAAGDTLLLVNRVLDGRFDAGGSGIDLIASLAKADDAPPAMLISNYAESQKEAEAAGALPGFGKSDVGNSETKQRVADAIAAID